MKPKLYWETMKLQLMEKKYRKIYLGNIYVTKNTDTNEDVKDVTEYQVVNIKKAGTYRISGSISNGQIAVDAGNSDEVKLILDGVDITCKTAPAIIIYNALDNQKEGEAGVTISKLLVHTFLKRLLILLMENQKLILKNMMEQ